MPNYIDGFVFPIAKAHLEEYKTVAEKVATPKDEDLPLIL